MHSVLGLLSISAVPGAQGEQAVAPPAAKVPGGQDAHTVDGSPSVSAAPAGQSSQAPAPE
jgi:hypothetical protein